MYIFSVGLYDMQQLGNALPPPPPSGRREGRGGRNGGGRDKGRSGRGEFISWFTCYAFSINVYSMDTSTSTRLLQKIYQLLIKYYNIENLVFQEVEEVKEGMVVCQQHHLRRFLILGTIFRPWIKWMLMHLFSRHRTVYTSINGSAPLKWMRLFSMIGVRQHFLSWQ